jgi:hypothetical protein
MSSTPKTAHKKNHPIMRRRVLILLFLALAAGFVNTAEAQRWKFLRYELIGGIGSINVLGDVGTKPTGENWLGIKDFRIDQTRPSISLGLRYKLQEKQVIRFNFNYGYAVGTDEGSHNDDRNFSFVNNLFEQSFTYEYYFISEEVKRKSASMYNRRGMLNNFSKLAVYGFVGAGLCESFIKPDASFVPTPSQFVYKNAFTLVLPVGIGVKYILNERWSIGAEFGGRYSFTDKLDGYSSAFSKFNDFYYLGTIHLSYRLKTDRNGMPAFLSRRR